MPVEFALNAANEILRREYAYGDFAAGIFWLRLCLGVDGSRHWGRLIADC